jgi:Spy/CpxP family protein refolding chaperone
MKKLIPALLAVVVIATITGARAGEPPAPLPPPMPFGPVDNLTPAQQQATAQIFSQAHAQVQKLQHDAHVAVLAAMTPQHRELLGRLVAALVLSPDLDEAQVTRQLDTALTPTEARSILSVAATLDEQVHQTFANARQQAENVLTPDQRKDISQHVVDMRMQDSQDPGQALLMIALQHQSVMYASMRMVQKWSNQHETTP